jgi:hypothetical protein
VARERAGEAMWRAGEGAQSANSQINRTEIRRRKEEKFDN